MKKIIIDQKNTNVKVKDFLLKEFPFTTSSQISKQFKKGNIKLNNLKITNNQILKANDEIKIFVNLKETKIDDSFLISKINFKVFYEDENVLIINKDRNTKCQEDKVEKINHLNNQIKKYLYLKKEWDPSNSNGFKPNLCHRLDKNTIGLIIAAKNEKAMQEIYSGFTNNYIQKYYLCNVYGKLKNKKGTLIDYIMINEKLGRMEIDKKNLYNKKIITHYEVLEENKNFSKLLIKLETGKKHQIRVHMAHISHPILGDEKYNDKNQLGFKNICLAASKIVFNFPSSFSLCYLNKKEFELKNIVFN